MPFDEALADRVRALVARQRGFVEKRMFGGVGFLLYGNMCVGVWKEFLIVRVGAEAYEDSLAEPHVREFDITGRPMTGWVMVPPAALSAATDLETWLTRALRFVKTLPKKEP